jgi:hypothetical protein
MRAPRIAPGDFSYRADQGTTQIEFGQVVFVTKICEVLGVNIQIFHGHASQVSSP